MKVSSLANQAFRRIRPERLRLVSSLPMLGIRGFLSLDSLLGATLLTGLCQFKWVRATEQFSSSLLDGFSTC